MPTTRKVAPRKSTAAAKKAVKTLTGRALELAIKEFQALKTQVSVEEVRLDEAKKTLSATVETDGYLDDKGNFVLELDPVEVTAWDNKQKKPYDALCTGLIRQRRASQVMDEEMAEKILRANGIYDECVETIEVIQPDLVTKALYQKKITEAEFDKMFTTKIIWAFVPQIKAK